MFNYIANYMNRKLSINRIILITGFILFLFSDLQAQITIKGHISDKQKEPYVGCTVVLKALPDSTIIGYDFSNEHGNFNISYDGKAEMLEISISGMQITPQSKNIENKTQTVNFTVEEEDVQLKEIVIKSTKMWGAKDTVNYLVSEFSERNDIVIGDVLRKMPGIDVSESGAITYQGKPINNFYIENLDLLGGRYGIAANNISAKDVSTVQVLENHQPVKALDGIKISNDAAINLKLKEGAKGAFSIMAQLRVGGSPFIWENELNGMYFTKKKQNISTYKANNSGLDLSQELTSFTTNNRFGSNDMLGVVIPTPPSIKEQRYLFNNLNAVTVNNLFKTDEESQLNFNLIYLNDHENRESNSVTSYFLSADSTLIMNEDMRLAKNTDRLEAEFRYNVNKANNYFNNYLNLNGSWVNNLAGIVNQQNIEQRLKEPSFSLTNSLHWVKKKEEDRGFEVQSMIGFKSSPQTLTIQPGLYADIFNNGKDFSLLRQKARINSLYIDNNVTLLSPFRIGNVSVDPKFGFGVETKDLNSDIYTAGGSNIALLEADSLRNNLNWSKFNSNISIALRYDRNGLKFNAQLPLHYNHLRLDNKITDENKTKNRIRFEPFVSLKYQLTGKTDVSGMYRFYSYTGNINTLYTGYIMQNYRSINLYNSHFSESKGHTGNLTLSYKDVIKMLFASGGISYNYTKSDMMYGQEFRDILTLTSAIEQDNSMHGMSVDGRISKGFYFMGITVALQGSYGAYSSEQLRQGALVKYKNNGLNLSGTLNATPFSWLILAYNAKWNRSRSEIESHEVFSPIRIFTNNISGDIKLPADISLYANYEHYYNSGAIGNRYLSFTDLGLKYNWKTYNISLTWNNIFDTRKYISAYYSSINSYYQNYDIRGSNVLLKVRMKIM